METVSGESKQDGKGMGFSEMISIAGWMVHASRVDKKLAEQVLPLLKQVGVDPNLPNDVKKLKSDIDDLKKRLDQISSKEEREKQTEIGLDLLNKKYLICMCSRSSVPSCIRWCFDWR